MKAAVVHEFKGLDAIEITDVPKPTPKSGEVLIHIRAAGVNPVDWKIAEGLLKSRIEYEMPVTLGWDCSGVIEDANGSSFKKGDEVYAYCLKPQLHDGTYAEYICIEADKVAYKPKNLSFEEAAVVPLSSLTAWQSLVTTAKIRGGQTVLIHAGAGGVGSFAIQIAKHYGCHVITTASSKNHAYCELLGADEIIDYTQQNWRKYIEKHHPDGIDMVYNNLSEEAQGDCLAVTKKGGFLVTLLGSVNLEAARRHGVEAAYVFVQPNQKELQQITELIEEEKIKPPVIQESFPLEKAADALRLSRSKHVQGKLVLTTNG